MPNTMKFHQATRSTGNRGSARPEINRGCWCMRRQMYFYYLDKIRRYFEWFILLYHITKISALVIWNNGVYRESWFTTISVTVSRENTKNFTVKREVKNTVYRFRTLFSRFKDLPLKYQKFYRLPIFRPIHMTRIFLPNHRFLTEK
jgi:hypothetical protein